MSTSFIATFLDLLIWALTLAIFGRVIMSWISPTGDDPLTKILIQISEPILGPIRRVVPPMGMFDLTPMVAILLLNLILRPLVAAF